MKKGLILHMALLAGSIAVFMGVGNLPETAISGEFQQTAASEGGRVLADLALPAGQASKYRALQESGSKLDRLSREQARLNAELRQLKAQYSRESAGGGNCQNASDVAPGVTVYLETTPLEAPSSGAPRRQWTAVSYKNIGQAPDGSNQAVMSIHKFTGGKADEPPPKKPASHWQ